jgi:cytochrome c oxidase subunit 2
MPTRPSGELAELKARGEKVYAANCAACHQADGKGLPRRLPGAGRLEGRHRAGAAHIDLVLNGKPAPRWRPSSTS